MSNGEGSRQPEQWRPASASSALRNYSQEQTKKTQSDSTVALCTFDSCSWATPRKTGKKEWAVHLKLFPHPASFSFLFLTRSPSSPSSTSVGTLTSVLWKPAVPFFHSTQGATQDSWNRREPGLTHRWYSIPALWSSEPPAPFPGPIVITKDLRSLWTAKQENTHLP